MKTTTFILFGVALAFTSCENYDRSEESVSSGKLKIGIDDSYSLMMDSQIDVFEKIYQYADIIPKYEPEADVLTDLLNDSIQAAILNRPLNESEMAMFKSKQRLPESVKIAVDAVALIVHPENPDSIVTMEQLEAIFLGKDTLWRQLTPGSKRNDPIKVVFDNNKSCNARYIREKFINGGEFPPNCFAVNSNKEVFNFVSQNKSAIGVLSVSWISDKEDSVSRSFLNQVKVMGIINPAGTSRPELARQPYQAYIYDQSYPLVRDVYAIRTGLRGTVGTGFVSFLTGEKGQLIIHKMGMVAATAPVRTIKLTQ
ncbi:MAG: substrate-binding domain-containing protein [Crocinitomicaceae bacterium]|nr:substrate-binding domain-containing protein [Crocinitomicaceae bacterium]